MIKMINKISKILIDKKVECYNKDFSEIIKKYKDDANCFLYLDPPYWKQGKQLYNIGMETEQYKAMADLLKNCKANWMISHDNNPEFLKLFDWAKIKTIENVPYSINSIKNNRKSELLLMKN